MKLNKLNFMNQVRSRDKWVCQACGSVEYPQAHHILPVSQYPLFQNLPDNGVTLCVYCHADEHPKVPRNLFIANAMKAEKEGCVSAGKLAKELDIHPRTVVKKAVKLGILKPMQKWMFTESEARLIRERSHKAQKMGKPFIIRLDEKLHQQIKIRAAQHGIPMWALIKTAIIQYLKGDKQDAPNMD